MTVIKGGSKGGGGTSGWPIQHKEEQRSIQ